MATLYNAETATTLFDGMQGSDQCDEAWDAALAISREHPDTELVLEDDDGVYTFLGGHHRRIAEPGDEWDGETGYTH